MGAQAGELDAGAPAARPTAVLGWLARARPLESGALLPEGQARDGRVHLVRSGWLARGRMLRNGRRQLVQLFLPGEPVLPAASPSTSADAATVALGLCSVAVVSAEEVEAARARNPALEPWLTQAERRALATLEERVVSLGQRSAAERTAHLFCELRVRSGGTAAGAWECALPVTQADLADVLGLSVVHMNRTLKLLREVGLADVRRGRVSVPDAAALAQAGGFDPGYLA